MRMILKEITVIELWERLDFVFFQPVKENWDDDYTNKLCSLNLCDLSILATT